MTVPALTDDLFFTHAGLDRARVETVVADVSRVADCRLVADTALQRFGGTPRR